jgi:transcriptional regulator with XRE-family HTH domain
MDKMGKRIKKQRESIGLQMKELSVKIGVTPSLISQIENGKAYPSIVTLKKVAEALNTTVGELIGENEGIVQKPVLKKSERRFAKENGSGTSSHLLSNHHPSKQIEPYIIEFQKGSDSHEIMTSNFPGQEFCFVLKGSFEAEVNQHSYKLNEGDSFYFDSSQTHIFKNTSDKKSQLLWVITPNKN